MARNPNLVRGSWTNPATGRRVQRDNFTDEVERDAWLEQQTALFEAGVWVDPTERKLTVRSYGAGWLDRSTNRPNTKRARQYALDAADVVGDVQLDRLRQSVCQAQVDAWVAEGKAPNTVREYAKALHMVVRDAVKRGHLDADVWVVDVPAAPSKRQRAMPNTEPDRVMSDVPEQQRAVVAALAFTGARIGEVLALGLDDIDTDAGVVHVWQQRLTNGDVLAPIKNDNVRTVPLADELLDAIVAHVEAGHHGTWVDANGVEHELLFPQTYRSVRHALDRAGSPTPHAYRRWFVSYMRSQGVPWSDIALWTGDLVSTLQAFYEQSVADPDAADRFRAALGKRSGGTRVVPRRLRAV